MFFLLKLALNCNVSLFRKYHVSVFCSQMLIGKMFGDGVCVWHWGVKIWTDQSTEAQKESKHHDWAKSFHSSHVARYFLSFYLTLCFSFLLPLRCSLKCRAFLFVCSCWALPVDPVPDFPKADINITGHCNGVIFMEAPEEVTWLWLVPGGLRVPIKPVVLTHITINEVEKLRK